MSTQQHTPQERIRFQLAWNRLLSVVEEQAQVLIRSAFGTATREAGDLSAGCLLYTSPSPRDQRGSRMPSSA